MISRSRPKLAFLVALFTAALALLGSPLQAQVGLASADILWTRHAASALSAADVDGDGRRDLLMGANERFAWARNQGNGFLGAPTIFSTAQSVASIRGADMDGDGDTDIVLGHRGALSVRENVGAQSFRNVGNLATGSYFTDMALANLDGDLDLDILAFWRDAGGGATSSRVIRVENLGGMSFGPAQVVYDPMGPGGGSVYADDLDLDGDQEILFATSGGVAFLDNLGQGSFGTPIALSTSSTVADILTADLNGDGLRDIVTSEGGLTWYLNQSTAGAPSFAAGQPIATLYSVYRADAADVDQDGDVDLVTNGNNRVVLYSNLGTGTFSAGVLLSDEAQNSRDVFLEDLSGNGYPDVLYAGWSSQEFVLRRNMGPAWASIAQGIEGTNGVPVLFGLGPLRSNTPLKLCVSGALPSAPALLVFGTSRIDLPLLGGALVPLPEALVGVSTDAQGQVFLPTILPRGRAGLDAFIQFWVLDPGAAQGFAATTGLRATSQR